MSWQAASMLLLAGALVGGALWYERSRPRPQVIALVAAMAALAAAGRVIFSPIPNVVPTTDLAVFSGYALGGAPGFMVGALSALVSNLWLGQGPWTPWQMAGWGLAGLFGAGLAVATGRRMGRFGFAFACGAMGLLYGALLDYSAMVVFGGEQSVERYLALSVRGIPFNLAHAAGNFAIALVAGPAIVGLLERHRRRFTHRWEETPSARMGAGAASLIVALSIAAGLLAGGGTARAVQSPSWLKSAASAGERASSALDWLQRTQNQDGGFGFAPRRESDTATTGWVALAIAASGRNPTSLRSRSGRSAIDYLRAHAEEIQTTGDLERTILALAASGLDPRRFGGVRPVRRLRARVESDGSLGGQVNLTAFYLLAFSAANLDPSPKAITWLKRAQATSGGWGYGVGVNPDADSTGAAIQALVAVGTGRGRVTRGVTWLKRNQHRHGGWGLPGAAPNTQSTAWAVQGLLAAGQAPGSVRRAGRSPVDYLAARQTRDGHFRYSSSSDQTPVWVTAQALVAVAGEPFPLAPTGSPSYSGSPSTPSRRAAGSPAAAGSADGDRDVGTGEGNGTGWTGEEAAVTDETALPAEGAASPATNAGSWIGAWWWAIALAMSVIAGAIWLGVRIRDTIRS